MSSVRGQGLIAVRSLQASALVPGLGAMEYAGYMFEDIFDVKEKDPDGKFFDRGALPAVPASAWALLLPTCFQNTIAEVSLQRAR